MKKIITLLIISLAWAAVASAQVLTSQKSGKYWGFVNEQDSFVIAPKYTAVGDFEDAYTWVNMGGKTKYAKCPEGGKWGVIDSKGNEVCPVQYDYVDFCANGKVAVNVGGVVKKGKITGGKWGYVDLTTGKEIIAPQYGQATYFTEYGVAWVEKEGAYPRKLWTDISKNSKGKIENITRLFTILNHFSISEIFDNPNRSGYWGLINEMGKPMTEFTYNNVGDFYEGVAWVVKNQRYGMLDPTGKICIPFQYNKLSNCQHNVVWAWNSSDKIGLLDKTGTQLLDMKYNEVTDFEDGVAWAKVGNLFSLVSATGNELTQPRYKNVSAFSNGIAHVWSDQDAVGAVNKTGKVIVRTIYDECPKLFGICQFKYSTNGQVLSWFTKLGMGTIWVDQDGNVITHAAKPTYGLTDKIPDAIWDY